MWVTKYNSEFKTLLFSCYGVKLRILIHLQKHYRSCTHGIAGLILSEKKKFLADIVTKTVPETDTFFVTCISKYRIL